MRWVIEFKCAAGHVTEKKLAPGQPYGDWSQIPCPKCWDELTSIKQAYILFAHQSKD